MKANKASQIFSVTIECTINRKKVQFTIAGLWTAYNAKHENQIGGMWFHFQKSEQNKYNALHSENKLPGCFFISKEYKPRIVEISSMFGVSIDRTDFDVLKKVIV